MGFDLCRGVPAMDRTMDRNAGGVFYSALDGDRGRA
jgi:hypothetical protein